MRFVFVLLASALLSPVQATPPEPLCPDAVETAGGEGWDHADANPGISVSQCNDAGEDYADFKALTWSSADADTLGAAFVEGCVLGLTSNPRHLAKTQSGLIYCP